MKYLCLIYSDEKRLETIPRRELDAMLDSCEPFSEGLRKNGQLIAAERLQPVSAATTIRLQHGKPSITDGPFAETKEQLGGFYLIEAKDLNDAIKIASNIPPARLGCVEVRPVWA
ncbi:MAG: YciI family protein [Woeseia sp.]